jgi:ribosomal-protein-alanine N-acetyltransferase
MRGEPRVIGAVEFGLDGAVGSIHYALGEEYWNKGLMTEACRAVLAWAFGFFPNLERVTTSAVVENRGSIRVMEKCGLEFLGCIEEKWDKFPQPVRLAVYSITRDRWTRSERSCPKKP